MSAADAQSRGMERREAALFLQSLKEEGIEEVFLEAPVSSPQQAVRKNQTAASPSESAEPASPEIVSSGSDLKEVMTEFRSRVQACTRCSELSQKRKNVVFGSGNLKAQLVFVGEAPGADEDEQGLPFVGRAGQLLTKIIESIGLTRRQVFICNVLKCRPPGNRAPKPDEIANCQEYLLEQIRLIQPKVICALGTFAAQTLLKSETPISRLRGRFRSFPHEGLSQVQVLCTYHPAYLLRNPESKRDVWEDMKKIRQFLAGEISA